MAAEEKISAGRSASVAITRTNDTAVYAANDVIGAATGSTAAQTFSKLAPQGGGAVLIRSTTLEVDAAAIISGETSYLLHLYSDVPPSALGDNVAWDLASGDRGTYLGSLALGTPADIGSSLYIAVDGINKEVFLPGENLYGYLVTVGTYTPTASRVYRIKINAEAV